MFAFRSRRFRHIVQKLLLLQFELRYIFSLPLLLFRIAGFQTASSRRHLRFCYRIHTRTQHFQVFWPVLCVSMTLSQTLHMYWYMPSSDCQKCGRCGTAPAGTLPAQACGDTKDDDGHGSHVAGASAVFLEAVLCSAWC
jgi:hypothetical protein